MKFRKSLLGLVILIIYLPIAIYYHNCTKEIDVVRLQNYGPCSVYSYMAKNKILFGFSLDPTAEKGWINPDKPTQIVFHENTARNTDICVGIYAVVVAIAAVLEGKHKEE